MTVAMAKQTQLRDFFQSSRSKLNDDDTDDDKQTLEQNTETVHSNNETESMDIDTGTVQGDRSEQTDETSSQTSGPIQTTGVFYRQLNVSVPWV